MRKLVVVSILLLLAPALFADSTATFKAKCAMCHGQDGAGQTSMGKTLKLRDLGSVEVQKLTDEALAKIISDGKGKMPAFKTKMSGDEIGAMVTFLRTLKN